jgi:hypothetical protein
MFHLPNPKDKTSIKTQTVAQATSISEYSLALRKMLVNSSAFSSAQRFISGSNSRQIVLSGNDFFSQPCLYTALSGVDNGTLPCLFQFQLVRLKAWHTIEDIPPSCVSIPPSSIKGLSTYPAEPR